MAYPSGKSHYDYSGEDISKYIGKNLWVLCEVTDPDLDYDERLYVKPLSIRYENYTESYYGLRSIHNEYLVCNCISFFNIVDTDKFLASYVDNIPFLTRNEFLDMISKEREFNLANVHITCYGIPSACKAKLTDSEMRSFADKCTKGSTGITSATDITDSYDIYMLMEYSADTGPDTMGMEGDEFYCLGKFFAKDLATAKREFESAKSKHSNFDFSGLYIDNYNEYFDDGAENDFGMPEVYDSIESLIDTLDNEEYYWRQKMSTDLPFDLSDPAEESFFDQCVNAALDSIASDPRYADEIADIQCTKNEPNATYDMTIYLEDGSSLDYSFDMNDIIKCEDIAEGTDIIVNSLYAFLRKSGI